MSVRPDQGGKTETKSAEGRLAPNRGPHFMTRRDSKHGTYQSPPISLAGTGMHPTGGATQATLKKQQRSRKSTQRSYGRIRRYITWVIGGCVAALSFVAVLWLTGPVTAPPTREMTILTNAVVSNGASLMAAVQSAGLRGTLDVKGEIEEIRRLESDRVTIKGWTTDTTAPDSALTVVAFAGGRHVLTTATAGRRAALAKMLGLVEASQTGMSFQGEFACSAGEKVIVIAVTAGAGYSQFRSLDCP
jgi:hypothetical protein